MDHDFATPPLKVEKVTLEGEHVRLEPMELDRLDELWAVANDESLWRWIPFPIRTRDDLRAYVEQALIGRDAGTMLPFVTVERATGRVVGSSRFGNIVPADYRAEIGWTWVGVPPIARSSGARRESTRVTLRWRARSPKAPTLRVKPIRSTDATCATRASWGSCGS